MSTDIVSTELRMLQLRHRLDDALAAKEQAERAQADAEAAKERAEERAFHEESRADGNEAHVIGILTEHIVDPTGELPKDVAEAISESIRQDLDGGLAYEDITVQAARLRDGYWEEQR